MARSQEGTTKAMERKEKNGETGSKALAERTPLVVTVDYEKYERFLKDSDWSEEQKCQFIDALWRIIVSFVDLGFGVHPAQQACGQLEDIEPNAPPTASDEVKCPHTLLVDKFTPAAGSNTPVEAQGDDYETH